MKLTTESSSSGAGQTLLAERVRDLQRVRHEARQRAAVHRRGEEEQQPGPGAVAHHRLPRQGSAINLSINQLYLYSTSHKYTVNQ